MIKTPHDDDWAWYVEGVRFYTALIRNRTPFALANYGDGEWSCILGDEGKNVNGEVYNPELAERLRRTLLEPAPMIYGVNPGARLRPRVDTWIEENDVDVPTVYKEHLSAANAHGQLAPFFRALRERRVVLVGGPHLSDLPDEVIGEHKFVEVSESEAWRQVGFVHKQLMRRSIVGGDVILFACGMGSNLMIHGLKKSHYGPDNGAWIDIGAILDPYVGVYSRKKYREDLFRNEIMEKNLP